jgi:hypothetical protein
MLTKQPLRYLLADNPGSGKTIMTGLLLKELMIRGDARRCLIVARGNLVVQWQDELSRKFHLAFEILTNDPGHDLTHQFLTCQQTGDIGAVFFAQRNRVTIQTSFSLQHKLLDSELCSFWVFPGSTGHKGDGSDQI